VVPQFKDDGIFRPEGGESVSKPHHRRRPGFAIRAMPPRGPVEIFGTPDTSAAYRIIQSATVIAVLFESGPYRQIFMDGANYPKDPNPTWMGYRIGM